MTDRVSAALALAQREAREGRLSAEAARQLLEAVAGDAGAIPEIHTARQSDPRLDGRDELVRRLSDLAPSPSTWSAAGRVAGWLRRWCAGDPLFDAPAGAGDLCAAVGKPVSRRQCFRILSGDRSG